MSIYFYFFIISIITVLLLLYYWFDSWLLHINLKALKNLLINKQFSIIIKVLKKNSYI